MSKRKYVIAGGSGFLGMALARMWTDHGDEVVLLSRGARKGDEFREVHWDGRNIGPWLDELNSADVLINMAGKSVDCRYTEKNKKEILQSRIESTRVLQQAMEKCENPPVVWINSSSATIYRHAEDQAMSEAEGEIGSDFSMDVVKVWEAEFFKTPINGVRKLAARTSIVLGRGGGAFPKMEKMTRIGLGGAQGNGRQKVSWIHIQDFCRAIDWMIDKSELEGAVNVTSPYPIENKRFNELLRQAVGIPFGMPTPAFLLEIGAALMRTETELLLKSRWVIPEKLQHSGFTFHFERLENALSNLSVRD